MSVLKNLQRYVKHTRARDFWLSLAESYDSEGLEQAAENALEKAAYYESQIPSKQDLPYVPAPHV